jgi:hypothetical protein
MKYMTLASTPTALVTISFDGDKYVVSATVKVETKLGTDNRYGRRVYKPEHKAKAWKQAMHWAEQANTAIA